VPTKIILFPEITNDLAYNEDKRLIKSGVVEMTVLLKCLAYKMPSNRNAQLLK